jgi:hypothetical protein
MRPVGVACARLASFWDDGLPRPRYGVITGSPAPVQPLSASTTNPAAASPRKMPHVPGGGQVMGAAGQRTGHPQVSPAGLAMICRFIP